MKIRRMLTLLGLGAVSLTAMSTMVEAAVSDATINFTTEPAVQDVLDPVTLDPLPEGETPDGEVNVTPGLLTLDYVSNISFGEQTINTTTLTYNSTALQPYIQVTDIRGTGEGWRVKASTDGFSQTNNDGTVASSLLGSTIIFNNTTPVSNGGGVSPEKFGPIELSADTGEQVIVDAKTNEGMGTWITRWLDSNPEEPDNQSVTLTVPGGVAKTGTHTATITWTLESVPDSE